ncbi:hypothetical protein [Enterobacter sp. MGH 3]|uniref:hypothetical protein n=1 Tax=Enterobacter sp. MGH 3 TaxID=1329812 RepID=UPI000516E1F4|nr:hypothetical protein [Enterobacter sp. MGH 3]
MALGFFWVFSWVGGSCFVLGCFRVLSGLLILAFGCCCGLCFGWLGVLFFFFVVALCGCGLFVCVFVFVPWFLRWVWVLRELAHFFPGLVVVVSIGGGGLRVLGSFLAACWCSWAFVLFRGVACRLLGRCFEVGVLLFFFLCFFFVFVGGGFLLFLGLCVSWLFWLLLLLLWLVALLLFFFAVVGRLLFFVWFCAFVSLWVFLWWWPDSGFVA